MDMVTQRVHLEDLRTWCSARASRWLVHERVKDCVPAISLNVNPPMAMLSQVISYQHHYDTIP